MHIPDGFVSVPVNAVTYGISAAVCGLAVARGRKKLRDQQVPILALTAAFIFAAQMLNFPVAGGTSGHFLGAMLAAILLGPLNGLLVMTVVLAIQALVFADGGLTALGSNIFNMGIVAGIAGYTIYWSLKSLLPKTQGGFLAAAALASWFSVVLASGACAVELAISGTSPLKVALAAMVGIHALIGIGEAMITAAVLSVVLASRADLIATAKIATKYQLAGKVG